MEEKETTKPRSAHINGRISFDKRRNFSGEDLNALFSDLELSLSGKSININCIPPGIFFSIKTGD